MKIRRTRGRMRSMALAVTLLAALSACAGLRRTGQPVAAAPSPPPAEAVDTTPALAPGADSAEESTPSAPAASGSTSIGQACTCVEAKPPRAKPRPRPKPVRRESPPQLPTAPVVSETAPGGVVNAQVREMGVSVMSILGKRVKGPKEEDLGRVVDVLADSTGRVRVAIIDFGGFLGVGNHRIAVDWPLLRFSPDARDPSLLLSLSREKLQAAPEYKDNPRPQTLMEPFPASAEPAAVAPAADSQK